MRNIGRSFALWPLTAICATTFANDGMYLSRGGVFYPTTETRISIAKEQLHFVCSEGRAQVQVEFEFNNPDPVERKVLVGFQAPMAAGDVSLEVIANSRIIDFKVQQDGKMLPYRTMFAECGDCPLLDPLPSYFEEHDYGIRVNLFEIVFKPGLNKVQHSYGFTHSSHVYFDCIYDYILTTGAKWSGGSIGDLTVQIDMGPNQYFYVSDIFGARAEWSIIGTGRITTDDFQHEGEGKARMVRTLNGVLRIHVVDLVPEADIEFGIISAGSFFGIPLPNGGLDRLIPALELGTIEMPDDVAPLSKEELALLRNLIYAQHGYAFKNKELLDRFSAFAWYMPDPNLTTDQIMLSAIERKLIAEIVAKERG